MVDDIVPKLLEDLKKEFLNKYKANKKIPKLLETKNHANAYLYAQEVGNILADVFDSKLLVNKFFICLNLLTSLFYFYMFSF